MWPESSNRIFRNVSDRLRNSSSKTKISKKLVNFLSFAWDVPVKKSQFAAIAVSVQLTSGELNDENLKQNIL